MNSRTKCFSSTEMAAFPCLDELHDFFIDSNGNKCGYKIDKLIKHGSFSKILLAVDDNSHLLAIKHVRFPFDLTKSVNEKHDGLEEKWQRILSLEHPNLVKYYGAKQVPQSVMECSKAVIVMEYCSGEATCSLEMKMEMSELYWRSPVWLCGSSLPARLVSP